MNVEPIQLTEYEPAWFDSPAIPAEIGEALWRQYGNQVAVEFPSPKTGGRWRLMPQGWVGHIPLSSEFQFALRPKVALENLFRMLEYAYNLRSFYWLDGLVDCQSLAEFYERLAHILAKQVLQRGRRGLYRAYVPHTGRLPYLRGRLDTQHVARSPGQVGLRCRFQEHTADVAENQILAWTLFLIARSGLCSERVLPAVRRAYRALQGEAQLQPYSAQACVGRQYNRLNDDYRPMHALSRFFLEHSGPGHQPGNRQMLPFLVDMARLFELFVAEWLKAHPPGGLRVTAQERVHLGRSQSLHFVIDLVLSSAGSGRPHYVLDTKYKTPDKPSAEDVQQMISYAHTQGCSEAILIYPADLAQPFDAAIRGIRVRSLTFALTGNLEQAGQSFTAQLLR